ncbi:hypothetical protein PVAP13_4NG174911 [Panicum virgatum]|uniref:Alpha-D-phosphohexomutase alpha/beta/alpha domain-containing protein n=1 Tax=Panicum virgatum TaxID=38727 RepID=A0A8T0T583_PANVG|nr:hypothetical protein PVAP13_4NG174911 [Panicum virgatum]
MATVTTSSPATLQSCKHASHGMVRYCPPLPLRSRRRSYGQVKTRATASSHGQHSAIGGRVEAPVGGEKGRPVDLTPLAVEVVAESFGEWLCGELQRPEGEELRVSVGRNPRLSGARLSAALFAGLARAGCSVFDMGLATTPACFMSTILPRFNYNVSIMVTLLSSVILDS